ncbi:hypothetical protein B5C34_02005 [Pacificimonas flava]|uniref:Histidine kinase domain-containing protein n=2 Tax=Pacificimonas TaxID=1960290 RepID=A0A219B1X6_9SPHN|nr:MULTISPECIES: ATP-binding protein [Pacificimonas]MBZ6378008.1 ATP-binding protein [Pacificimonas aurantium]OWV32347.1 hypothetical protein B5C34_02005 [Pacificimonas flava]
MQITTVRIAAEPDIARVRQVGDRVSESLGLPRFGRTRAVTACLELARNALQYAGGGRVTFRAYRDGDQSLLAIAVSDQGPGIDNEKDIMRGRSTFGKDEGLGAGGLGLGLRGVRRIADRFDLKTGSEGTHIEISFEIPVNPATLPDRVKQAADELLTMEKTDPVAELSRQNRQLAEALAERELLISEVHHRTGNNLALILGFIQLSRRSTNSDETRQILLELEMRVHSVAKVHQELQRAQQSDQVDLLPFLKSVSNHAAEAFSSDDCQVNVHVGGASALVRSSVAIDLGLIAGELITNSFKHAFTGRSEGRIDVRFEHDDTVDGPGAFSLHIGDDGKGLAKEEKRPERPESLGWRMIRSMARRHGGTIATSSETGFQTVIEFPPELVLESD